VFVCLVVEGCVFSFLISNHERSACKRNMEGRGGWGGYLIGSYAHGRSENQRESALVIVEPFCAEG